MGFGQLDFRRILTHTTLAAGFAAVPEIAVVRHGNRIRHAAGDIVYKKVKKVCTSFFYILYELCYNHTVYVGNFVHFCRIAENRCLEGGLRGHGRYQKGQFLETDICVPV